MLHAARPEDKDKDGRREGGAEEVVQRAHASPAAARVNNRRTKARRTVDKVDKPPAPSDLDLVGLNPNSNPNPNPNSRPGRAEP